MTRQRPLPSQLTQLRTLAWRYSRDAEVVDRFVADAERRDRATVQRMIRELQELVERDEL